MHEAFQSCLKIPFEEARYRKAIKSDIRSAIRSINLNEKNGTISDLQIATEWRTLERSKTVAVGIILCIHLGVDPPDSIKSSPYSHLQGWIDSKNGPPAKTSEAIGKAIQSQFEALHPRARYKLSIDPTIDELKKLCLNLRKTAKDDRILFHYNGHGVPKPTPNGEIWVFNKQYTQYLPVSIYEIQAWLGPHVSFIFDCSVAGHLINSFDILKSNPPSLLDKQSTEMLLNMQSSSIYFSACSDSQNLPNHPYLPVDLFTSCLTTPIEVAVRFYIIKHPFLFKILKLKGKGDGEINTSFSDLEFPSKDFDFRIPGGVHERKTPLGELHWVFTAITDAIAWNVLDKDNFKTLFRQDALVATIYRNFLFADKVLRSFRCSPLSRPSLPTTHNHCLWDSWDSVMDHVLTQLIASKTDELQYTPSYFFKEQLQAFSVWLDGLGTTRPVPSSPPQLPIVLQTLMSSSYRSEALILVARFFDFGNWACVECLTVGLIPYLCRLLQAQANNSSSGVLNCGGFPRTFQEANRDVILYLWSRILAVDISISSELLKEEISGYYYFFNILMDSNATSEQKVISLLILSRIASFSNAAKKILMKPCSIYLTTLTSIPSISSLDSEDSINDNILFYCLHKLKSNYRIPWIKSTALLLLSNLFSSGLQVKAIILNEILSDKRVITALYDPVPELRAAAVYTFGKLLRINNYSDESTRNHELCFYSSHNRAISFLMLNLLMLASDPSPIVREELVYALTEYVQIEQSNLLLAALEVQEKDAKEYRKNNALYQTLTNSTLNSSIAQNTSSSEENPTFSLHALLWKILLMLSTDSYAPVYFPSAKIVDEVHVCISISCAELNSGNISDSSRSLEPYSSNSGISLNMETSRLFLNNLYNSKNQEHHQSPTRDSVIDKKSLFSCPIADIFQLEYKDTSDYYEWLSKEIIDFQYQNRDYHRIHSTIPIAMDCFLEWKKKKLSTYDKEIEELLPFKKCIEYWTVPLSSNSTDNISHILFHPYEPLLFIADEMEIHVCNIQNGSRKYSFFNHIQPKSDFRIKIVAMKFIRLDYNPLLLVLTNDGVLRIWDNVLTLVHYTPILLSSFLSSTSSINTLFSASIDYHEDTKLLFILLSEKEILVFRIPSENPFPWRLTDSLRKGSNRKHNFSCLALCQDAKVAYVGTESGSLLQISFDKQTKITTETDFKIIHLVNFNCSAPLTLIQVCQNEVFALDSSGSIHVWSGGVVSCPAEPAVASSATAVETNDSTTMKLELEAMFATTNSSPNEEAHNVNSSHEDHDKQSMNSSIRKISVMSETLFESTPSSCIFKICLHPSLTLMASAWNDASLTLMSCSGDTLWTCKYHEGFLGQRMALISALAWHPHRCLLAVITTDSLLSLFTVSH